MNNSANPSTRKVEIKLEDFTSKLINDLKLISNEIHYSQMLNYINYLDTQVNVNSINVLPEYMSLRDKSITTERDVLVNTLFYYMYLYKSLVKSSFLRNIELKIIQEDPVVMKGNYSWQNRNLLCNSNNESFQNEKNSKNKFHTSQPDKYDNRHTSRTKTPNKFLDNNPRKTPNYIPSHLEFDQDVDVIMNGEMPNSFKNKNMDISAILFGDFEKSDKKSADTSKTKTDHHIKTKLQDNPGLDLNRSRSKSPISKDRIQKDNEEKNKRDKSIDRKFSGKDKVTDQKKTSEFKELVDDHSDKNQKLNVMKAKLKHENEKHSYNENKENLEKNRVRDRSKSPLRIDDSCVSEIKKGLLNKKRPHAEKDFSDSSILDNTLPDKKTKRFRENSDSLQVNGKNNIHSLNVDEDISELKIANTIEEKVNRKGNDKKEKRKGKEKDMSLTEIDSKLKDMLDRDEKYNLIMKYSHKITDPDNLKNLKTLIPKEISIKIENALNGKSKENISVDLYENDLIKIILKIFPADNKFNVARKLKCHNK